MKRRLMFLKYTRFVKERNSVEKLILDKIKFFGFIRNFKKLFAECFYRITIRYHAGLVYFRGLFCTF